ncbi:hypothetical protein BU24DRAFT_360149, partial [Aaosphaeria arxii CBS 175.79]
CLDRLFRNAFKDQGLFPPRCCREPIVIDVARNYLPKATLEAFFWAEIEFSVPNRTYCSNKLCGKFVPPDRIAHEIASCAACLANTCTTCKNASHPDTDCPADPHIQAVVSLGQQEGWQRCYKCRTMVELDHGCNHMRCVCSAEFCYLCGARWKTCRCDQWNEDRLVARARADRIDPPAERVEQFAITDLEVDRLVREMAETLRANHECRHRGWLTRIEGMQGSGTRFQCEMCSRRHSKFILRCPRCHIEICAGCRRNRLR